MLIQRLTSVVLCLISVPSSTKRTDTLSSSLSSQVLDGAELLVFDAAADLVLADGTTCTVEPLNSIVHVKGYKYAAVEARNNYAFNSIVTPGASGYVSIQNALRVRLSPT